METYTEMQSVEFEEMPTLGETGVSPMPNANVLVNFGENEEGNPTYKGKEIGNQRPTETFETSDIIAVETFNKAIAIYTGDERAPLNVEVADVEFFYNNEWVSIKHLVAYEDDPYFFSMYKTRTGNNSSGAFIASISYGTEFKGAVAQALIDYEVSSLKITYYTD